MDRTLEEWRDKLFGDLQLRRSLHVRPRSYYDGDHVRVTAPDKASDKYKRLAELAVTNLCGLIVDTVARRLIPKGVRIAGLGDDIDVWRDVWQANNLDGDMPVAFEEALKVGRCPILVWQVDQSDGSKRLRITIEDPDETIIAYAPGSQRERVAALKSFCDDDCDDVTVWTTTQVARWRRSTGTTGAWEPQVESVGTHTFGAVPVLELRSRPDIKGSPKPEISTSVIRLQDGLNKAMFDCAVATEDGAHAQRYTIGIEVETNAAGEAINPLKTGPNRVWALQSEGEDPSKAQIGQLEAYDITGLLTLAETKIRQIASVSVTPIFHLMAGLTNVGADTIRATERGHVDKCRGHQTTFDDTLEEMIRLGMIGLGMSDPPSDIAIDWEPIETRSPTELADAVIKLHQAGFPFPAIVRYMGVTQSEAQRILDEKKTEDAQTLAAKATPAAAPAVTSPVVPPDLPAPAGG